ncbi:hypothetical protein [Tardiphaga sp. 619_E2_N8_5]|jgi:RNA polymerase sigma-70 factor (ECF subfamily)|uniref:hypothetical protein n=1 Tax=unclassified Tardiphaga TaxID=2631404 RepID=UPI003F291CC1
MATTSLLTDDAYSVVEITEIITNLSDAELLRIAKASQYLSFGGSRSPQDLRQEAIKRAVAGSRKCPRRLNVVIFLYGAMRSIASADRKALCRSQEISAVPKQGSEGVTVLEGRDYRLSPEDELLQQEGPEEIRRVLFSLFEDDLVAQTLVEGMIEGMEGRELREFVGLSEVDFATKRRLVRRRIDKAFPKGWKR